MRSPHEQILDLVVKMDARDARKVRDMADAHLRDLDPEGMTPDGPVHTPPESTCLRCGGDWADAEHIGKICQNPVREGALHPPVDLKRGPFDEYGAVIRDEGAELQRGSEDPDASGLEAAVIIERERLDGHEETP